MQESESNILSMDAFDPESVRRFVQFLYTKDYSYDAVEIAAKEKNDAKAEQPAARSVKKRNHRSRNFRPTINTERNAQAAGSSAAGVAEVAQESAHTTDPLTVANSSTDEQPSATSSTSTARNTPVPSETPDTSASKDTHLDGLEFLDPVFRTILAHTNMNAMGDYYHVPGLVELANSRIKATLSSASPDAPWVSGLPVIAETALEIVDNEGLTDVLATTMTENLATIIAMGTLESSPLVTPFSLQLLKKCNAINQKLSETLSYKIRTLNEVNTKYQKFADQVLQQKKAANILTTTVKCKNQACLGRFECHFVDEGRTLRCRLCQMKHSG